MRFGKDDALPTGMLIVAACLYCYGHTRCGVPEHPECRSAQVYSVFALRSAIHTAGSNRIYVTHGRIPPYARKHLIDALNKQKAARRQADDKALPDFAQQQFRGNHSPARGLP